MKFFTKKKELQIQIIMDEFLKELKEELKKSKDDYKSTFEMMNAVMDFWVKYNKKNKNKINGETK